MKVSVDIPMHRTMTLSSNLLYMYIHTSVSVIKQKQASILAKVYDL